MKMNIGYMPLWLGLLGVVAGLLLPLPDALAQPLDKRLPKEPIQITSDRLEAFNDQRLVVFDGNAVAVQGRKVIRADKLLVYYKKGADDGKAASGETLGQGGDLDRIEARGRVSIVERNRKVTGEEAVYYQDDEKIVMTGKAVMREGESVVRGERITVLLNENRGLVEGSAGKRVTATIYPDESGKKKK
ncbi:MAG: LptA/OstA family protein [Pseudomonadota bacterium]|nr:LptA/OstA family protein [Pseudomonadota bacterium]